MTLDPDAIVNRIVKAPHLSMTDEEAATLRAVREPTLMMQKLLVVHAHKSGDFPEALARAEAVFAGEPTPENAKNVALLLRRVGRIAEAIDFAERNEAMFEPVVWNDTLCMMHNALRNTEKAAAFGTRSLILKDKATKSAPKLSPTVRPFDPEAPQRNVIAFSLWGSDVRYLAGALNNAVVARYLYPGWTARIYVDTSVPEATVRNLVKHGAQVVKVSEEKWPADRFGLFWRFLVEDDPKVDHYIIRDADSVMNIKERVAVEDWLASGKAFHVMRDLPSHSELILAGMWGAHRGNIGDMGARIRAHVDHGAQRLNNRTTDQEFLRQEIWPIVRQDMLMHDAWFDFGDPVRYRSEFQLPANKHIGQNDAVHMKKT